MLAGLISSLLFSFFWRTFSLYIPYSAVTSEKPMFFYPQINVFKVEDSFYKIITFMIFFFIFCLLIRFIEVFIRNLKITEYTDGYKIFTAIMGFLTAIFGLYIIFSALAMIPLPSIQNTLKNSLLVNILINGPTGWLFNQLWF